MKIEIKPIAVVLLFERIILIYRTLAIQNQLHQVLIYVKILLEICVSFIIVYFLANILSFLDSQSILTFVLSISNSLLLTFFVTAFSKKFCQLLLKFNLNHGEYRYNQTYQSNLKRIFRTANGFGTFIVLLQTTIALLIYFHPFNEVHYFVLLSYFYSEFYNLRNLIECLFISSLLWVMSEQLDCISRCTEEKLRVPILTEVGFEEVQENDLILDDFRKWSVTFTRIKEMSQLFNEIFGMQLTTIIVTINVYYISHLYSMTYDIVKGNLELWNGSLFSLRLSGYIILLGLLSRTAHYVEASVKKLRINLARLLLKYSLLNNEEYKATKDLLRMVNMRPIKIEAFGSLQINMTLLPTCVMMFTTYTVIALQFNNVL